jgi:xylose isomerase
MNKISAGVWAYGACSDRYVGGGYRDRLPLARRIEQLGGIAGVEGVEITYPGDFDEKTYAEYAPLLREHGLGISSVGVELVCDKEWQTGSFTSPDPAVRERAVALTRSAMDFAASLGVEVVSLWMGQDGHDYFMQADYARQWNWLVEGLRLCAGHNPKIKLGIEYKASEPRLSCAVRSGGVALALAQCAGCANVGVTMDVGHALNARENIAETAVMLLGQNRLFHLHLNDNYLIADDDMPIGSVHFLHFLELFFWLKRLGYKGWYCLDMYPYRDDPDEAVRASVAFVRGMERFVDQKLAGYDFDAAAAGAPGKILSGLFEKMFDRPKI